MLRASFPAAAAASAFLLVAACGGGAGGSDSVDSGGTAPTPQPTGGGGTSSNVICQRLGGNLFVADQGPIGVTLLSNGGSQHTLNGQLPADTFSILYDNVFGTEVSNRQDKWGSVEPFPPGTPVGTSTQVQLQPPTNFVLQGPIPPTFPKGIPLELWLHPAGAPGTIAREPNSSSTASIGKDILGADQWKTASVAYGPNNTATVTFFATTDGPYYSAGLTNVYGTGCS